MSLTPSTSVPLRTLEGGSPGVSLSSEADISERLRRLADQISHSPREVAAHYDELMVIHDELLEIVRELSRQIAEYECL
jgi:hypothetical protein